MEPDPDKVSALRTWPRPKTLGELKSFLGFVGCYCCFVSDYSKIVKPLNDLTGGYPPYRKGQKKSSPGGYFNPKEPFGEHLSSGLLNLNYHTFSTHTQALQVYGLPCTNSRMVK